MKRRVLVLNHFAIPRGSPGGTRHVELFGRLAGWDPYILAADRNPQTSRREPHRDRHFRTVPTTPISAHGLTRMVNWASYALAAFGVGVVSRPWPTVVYGSSPHLLAGLSAWAIARLRGARFVLEIRDLWPLVLVEMDALPPGSMIYRALTVLERFLYAKADMIVVLAEGNIPHLEETGVDARKVRFIPNGAEPSDFLPTSSRDATRRRLALSGFVFAYTGAHGEANGLDQVLDAAVALRREQPDICFLLIGDGPKKAALEARAKSEGLTNVRFLDPVPKTEIPDILFAADAGLHVLADVPLFRYGVSPNKVHDYMAAGLPVLTNTPGEVTRLVEQAGAGIGVEPSQLADGATTVALSPVETLAAWGENGRRFMEGSRSRRALAQQLESVLAEATVSL